MNTEQNEKITIIMNNYTYEQQREIFVEECAEAIKAVQKCKRAEFTSNCNDIFENLKEEVADVCIMAEQMKKFLGSDSINNIIDEKLSRQIRRIHHEQ